MGLPFSCPFADYSDVEKDLESIVVKSISLGDDRVRTAQRSVSFKGRDSETTILKSLESGEMVVEGSVSFRKGEKETVVSINAPSSMSIEDDILSRSFSSKSLEMEDPSPRIDGAHNAAVKLQKVYKSFRTRRKLADCAVLVEQSWWKLLDFAELKHSSISFFDIEHHETAISRWSRAKTRAAKVGKGLSKNDKAQKLALQHWLEAIDPRHRYGHNLHFYYVKWLQSQSREPFFYWLDIGEGKEVNLEKCSRCKLQQQCIKYLGPVERLAYEVDVENGKLVYKQSGKPLNTTKEPHAKWIFVLSTSKTLYVGKKKKGTFQHSSFLAGGATSAAGRLVVENGDLKAVWPHSGHYRPTLENFQDFVAFLRENDVDLSDVKMDPIDDDEESTLKQRSSHHLRCNSSEEDLIEQIQLEKEGSNVETLTEKKGPESVQETALIPKTLTTLQIPKRDGMVWTTQDEEDTSEGTAGLDLGSENQENQEQRHPDDSDDEDQETKDEVVPQESILKRINSHKETKSYQLGKQLSRKWSSGVGPRISCVRDYPSELQFRALEKVNLSPRSRSQMKCTFSPHCGSNLSPKVATQKTDFSETQPYRTWSSPLCEMLEVSRHTVF